MGRRLAIASAALLFLWLLPLRVLVVEERPGGRILFVRAVSEGDLFALRYRHSVEKCLVEDHYVVGRDSRLVLRETVFGSSNTGLPAVLSGRERLIRDGHSYRIVGMERMLTDLEVWVNGAYENALVADGLAHLLAPSAGDRLVRLRIAPSSPAMYLYLRTRLLFQ